MGSKHTMSDLLQMQSLPLEAKITASMRRIIDWHDYWDGDVAVSFSGGKDSTVLLHLVRSIYPDVPAVFADTGLEYPEIRAFVKAIPNVVRVKPEMRFDKVIKEYGYPVISKDVAMYVAYATLGRQWAINGIHGKNSDGTESAFKKSHYVKYGELLLDAPFNVSAECCAIMKERPLQKWQRKNKKHAYVGTMAAESARRRFAWLKSGCNAYDKGGTSKPLSFWTEQDVLHYIKKYSIPYCPIYGDIVPADAPDGQTVLPEALDSVKLKTTGAYRTGCMFCMFGLHLEKEPNRFQRMKQTHPKQWDYCIHTLGLGEVLDYIGVKYE